MNVNGPVICGIEDESGATVAKVARGLAERHGLQLLCVHVLASDDGAESAVQLLESAAPRSGELAIERGHPADRLVELARERDAAFLVVGNHGPHSSLLGSISADVSRRAPCPVIVVPPAAAQEESHAAAADPGLDGGLVRLDLARAVS